MKKEEDDFDSFLNSIGFGFPENSDELRKFDLNFANFSFKGDEKKVNAEMILKLATPAVVATNIDYHKRTVLAAEIVYRLKDDVSLGHLKLQKLLYLCQNAMKMKIHAHFLQQAMGPYDPKLMRSLDKQFEKNEWFKFQKDDFPKYIPLKKAGGHSEWYQRYYSRYSTQVEFLIETFREVKTSDIELIATIYACWSELKASPSKVDADALITSVYQWSPEKAKFSRKQILQAIEWMNEIGIVP